MKFEAGLILGGYQQGLSTTSVFISQVSFFEGSVQLLKMQWDSAKNAIDEG